MKSRCRYRVVLLLVVAAVLLLAACRNPLIDRMQSQVEQDVAVARNGKLELVSTSPADGAVDVPLTTSIAVTLSHSLNAAETDGSIVVTSAGNEISGTTSYDDAAKSVVFTPDALLSASTEYTVAVDAEVLESTQGVQLSKDHSFQFTTDLIRPDEIAVTVDYGGPYELSPQYPIYLSFLPTPWAQGDPVHEVLVESTGTVKVSEAELPATESGAYWLVLTHDFSGDYENFFDGASVSTMGFYDSDGTDNFTTAFPDVGTQDGTSLEADSAAQIVLGTPYALTYTDTELVSPDNSEPNEEWRDADPIAEMGPAYSKTIGWDDTDWYEFSPPVEDEYRFLVAGNVSSPYDEAGLELDYPVQVSVMQYESSSDDIAHKATDSDDPATESDNHGLVDAYLYPGETYLIKVTTTEKADVGEYKIKVVPNEVALDQDEPGNDSYVAGGGTEIPFGQKNYVERSLHFLDQDYLWIDNTGLNLPTTDPTNPMVYYAIDAARPSDEYVQDFQIGISVRTGDITGGAQYVGEYPTVVLPNPYQGISSEERREVRLINESYTAYYMPTGRYWLSFAYGPDKWDWDKNNNSYQVTRDNDITATADMDMLNVSTTDPIVTYHSIWETDDVDHIQVVNNMGTTTEFTITVSIPAAYSNGFWDDDFYVQMDVIDMDQSTVLSSSALSNGEGNPQFTSIADGELIFLKMYKASNSPLPTGAYRIEVTSN